METIFMKYVLYFILSIEHFGYSYIWFYPKHVMSLLNTTDPKNAVDKVGKFCIIQKLLQFSSLLIYGYYIRKKITIKKNFDYKLLLIGAIIIYIGQILNISVYNAIGKNGVYYGNRFGLNIPWETKFPYNIPFIKHPQYIGAFLSIIGGSILINTIFNFGSSTFVLNVVLFYFFSYIFIIVVESTPVV